MSGTVAIAVATSASVNAAIAAEAAHKAHVAACNASMPTFADASATVAQRQQYAECVHLIYPQDAPLSDEARWAVKGVILLVLLGIVAGIITLKRDRYAGSDVSDYLAYGFMGALFLPVGVGIVGALVAGICYLFT